MKTHTTAPCPCCGIDVTLFHIIEVRCCFCGAPIRRVGDSFALAGVPPIETRAEMQRRAAAVAQIGGAR